MTKIKKVRIAIQKNGRLREASLLFLNSIGLKFDLGNNGRFIAPCLNKNLEILLVRNIDIPEYVKNGAADFGIAGQNVLYERRDKIKVLRKLGFGNCKLIIAVPRGGSIKTVRDLDGERIATSYPYSLKKFLAERGLNASVITIKGSVEITPEIGLADAICDITQTGKTLREHQLRVLTTIMKSEAVLIGKETSKLKDIINIK